MTTASQTLIDLFNILEEYRKERNITLPELAERLHVGIGSLEKRRKAMKTGNTGVLVKSLVEYIHAIDPDKHHVIVPINLNMTNSKYQDYGITGIRNVIRRRKGTLTAKELSNKMGYKTIGAVSHIENKWKKKSLRGTYSSLWRYATGLNMEGVSYDVY